MKREDVIALPSMPAASPSYPRGPYRFIDREYLIITYETDAEALRDALPEPLKPDGSDTAHFEFIRMPDLPDSATTPSHTSRFRRCSAMNTSTSLRRCISTTNRPLRVDARYGAFRRNTPDRDYP